MQYPVRIAHVVGKVTLGGVDAVVMNYYRHIDRAKVQFDFFMDGLEKSPIDDEIEGLGGRIFKLTPYDKDMNTNLREFRKILNEERYRIVHCHMNTLSVFWLREAKRAGIPIRIAHNHSTAHWGEGKRTLMKYVLRLFSTVYPTHLFSCSEQAGRWLFKYRKNSIEKVTIIHNAIDLNKFSFNPVIRESLRNLLGLRGKFVIGHVGRFMYQKNHQFLLDVFAQIYKNKPDAVLMLVGDGELKADIERSAAKMELSDAVLFLGTRRDVHELYQAMDVFLLPSFYEGFGIVALEAQAAGLPCVVSDKVPDETMVTSACIKLPLKSTSNEWASVILKINATDRENEGVQALQEKYDIVKEARSLEELYKCL